MIRVRCPDCGEYVEPTEARYVDGELRVRVPFCRNRRVTLSIVRVPEGDDGAYVR